MDNGYSQLQKFYIEELRKLQTNTACADEATVCFYIISILLDNISILMLKYFRAGSL